MPKSVIRPNMYAPKKSGAMGNMNVTPFIDVLLVLLIMIIMAVPVQVHQTSVDLPQGPTTETLPVLVENTVAITPQDQLLWNGTAITREQLTAQVAAASALEEEPLLRFQPAALASYGTSARAITLIKEAGATRFAFIGNAQHQNWD